jgi:glucose/arabinose dehydrogenase
MLYHATGGPAEEGFMRRARIGLVGVLALALLVAPAAVVAQDGGGPDMGRIRGDNRFETAEALAYEAFPDGAQTAYLATTASFADALAAGPAAAREGGPVLLVRQASVPGETERALEQLGVRDTVVLGGGRAIGSTVTEELERITGNPPRRVSGATRFETAAAVAGEFDPGVEVVYVANGTNFPDALGGGAAGAARGGPVLLAQRDALGEATREALRRLRPDRVLVLGGSAVLSGAVIEEIEDVTGAQVRRLSGPDRFATSAAISAGTYPAGAVTAFLATGDDFPDALAAGAVAGLGQAPLLLSRRDCVPGVVLDELERLGVGRVVLVGGGAALAAGPARLEPCGIEVTEVALGLRAPWDVTFTSDGRTFVSERDAGRVIELFDDARPEVVHTFAVDRAGEGGLLGLVASPNFADDGLLFAYLTTNSDNSVVRFEADDPANATVIVEGIPSAGFHNGGRMAFDPNGPVLYIGTGDAGVPARAQDPASLGGKILRVRPDGSAPSNNPTPGSRVFASGFRNVQGLAFVGAQLYATDFGPGCDDEVNRIVAGGNYGWPDACGQTRPGARPPIVVRQPAEASWSGLAAMQGGLVSAWEGDLFAAALRGQRLWRFELSRGAVTEAQSLLQGEYGRLRHVAQAPDGSLWVLTNNRDGRGSPRPGDDRILRLAPPGW